MTSILWEFFFCMIDIFIFDTFMNSFFFRKKLTKTNRVILFFTASASIFLSSYFIIFSYSSTFTQIIIIIIYGFLMFNSTKLHILNNALFFIFLYNTVSSIQIMILTILLEINVFEIFTYDSLYRIIFILISRIMIYMLWKYTAYRFAIKKGNIIFERNFFYLFASGAGFGSIFLSILFQSWNLTKTDFLLLLICFVTIIYFVYFIYQSLFKEKLNTQNINVVAKFEEINQTYIDNANKKDVNIRIIKHDLRNNLLILDTLLAENKIDEAKRYINSLQGSRALTKEIDCGNYVIDALLNVRMQMNQDIDFDIKISIEECAIEATVLCAIISNLLDNAIEATHQCVENKTISFSITESTKVIKIVVKNKFKETPLNSEGILLSLKEDKDNHGLGILSIEQAARKYNGSFVPNIDFDKKEFEATVILFKSSITN